MRTVAAQYLGGGTNAGGVDHAVQAAERGDRQFDGRLDLLFAGHVGLRKASLGAECLLRCRAGFRVHIKKHGVSAGGDNGLGTGAAQARGATGNDEGVAGNIHPSIVA